MRLFAPLPGACFGASPAVTGGETQRLDADKMQPRSSAAGWKAFFTAFQRAARTTLWLHRC